MEKSNSESLSKSRSSRSCIRTGYHLFMSQFRGIIRRSWIAALAYGLCFSTLATILVIYYPRLNLSVLVNPQSLTYVVSDYIMIFSVTLVAIIAGAIAELILYATGLKVGKWRTTKAFLSTLLVALPLTILTFGIGALLALPLAQSLFSYLFTPGRKYWNNLWPAYKIGFRHWGKWFVVFLITSILTDIKHHTSPRQCSLPCQHPGQHGRVVRRPLRHALLFHPSHGICHVHCRHYPGIHPTFHAICLLCNL